MKPSQIGASIVGFATGIGAIFTVIQQWHNIAQWALPSAGASPSMSSPIPATSTSDQLAGVCQNPIYVEYWDSDGVAARTKKSLEHSGFQTITDASDPNSIAVTVKLLNSDRPQATGPPGWYVNLSLTATLKGSELLNQQVSNPQGAATEDEAAADAVCQAVKAIARKSQGKPATCD
jgi:hypothetical protein